MSFAGGQDAVADVGGGAEHNNAGFNRSRAIVFLLPFTSNV